MIYIQECIREFKAGKIDPLTLESFSWNQLAEMAEALGCSVQLDPMFYSSEDLIQFIVERL